MTTDAFIQLLSNEELHPVVPFNEAQDKLISIDLSVANGELENVIHDTHLFSDYIFGNMQQQKARYAIGGYDEHRTVYAQSKVFDANNEGGEPRRLHLGTDIWGKPYTPVMAPLDGILHSFADNDEPGNYGGTIILSHHVANMTFYTLYGHLSRNSLKNLVDAQRIEKGEVIGDFGIPSENGNWPPHLHFQVIFNIGEYKGDYPGVCRFSEKEKWLANSPDPDVILGLNRFL